MLEEVKKIYMIGIKGAGMTALAQILQARGVEVSGSDTEEKFYTDEVLERLKIPFKEGFNVANIPDDAEVVIRSNAYDAENNEEVQSVESEGLPVITYPEALAELFNNSWGIAICGTHGKSTTTAMLGFVLEYAGLDPTVVVGSRVNQWKSNARAGKSEYFVLEADEYKGAFLKYKPKMILMTNIEFDHPDYFKDAHAYRNVFQEFLFTETIEKVLEGEKMDESLKFNLKLPGEYNQQNARLAYNAALELGVSPQKAKEALESFEGIARRFEYYGNYKGAELYDDYAHHPTEVSALLGGVKEKYSDKKINIIFQPHTISRTKALFDEFVKCFEGADRVYILKSYNSAREEGDDVYGRKLAEELSGEYFETCEEAADKIGDELDENTVFLTVGAGDAWRILNKWLNG